MTLPVAKPISLTQIVAEFNAPAGTPLSAFVRGGAYVPDTVQNAGVPTAKPIALSDLLGARDTELINPGTQTYSFLSFLNPTTSGIRIGVDETRLEERENNAFAARSSWLAAGGTIADYEVLAHLESSSGGNVTGDTLDVWHGAETVVQYNVQDVTTGSGGSATATFTVTIRSKTAPSDSVTFTLNLTATADIV